MKSMSPVSRTFSSCLVFAFVLMTGCGGVDPSLPKVAPVKGIVTYQGKPIDMGVIIFFPQDITGAKNAASAIRTGGVYELSTYGDANNPDGAAIGPHKVQIDAYDGNTANQAPGRYADRNTTPLTYEVKPGENIYNIELTDEDDAPTGEAVNVLAPGR
jgi:hypothetical protein